VLEGSVRRDGNRVRITAQLIEARSGAAMLARIPARFSEQLRRHQQRPAWIRLEDFAIRQDGLRLAGHHITEPGVSGI